MTDPHDPHDLQALHERVHAGLEELLWRTIEALVQLDVARARATFDHFVDVIERHMAFEDEHVLPRYAPLAPKDGPGRLDHVQGDHTILQRHVVEIDALIADLAEHATLRVVLERLPPLYRVLNVLEHHTMRERTVYGAIAATADDALHHGLEECLVDVDATV